MPQIWQTCDELPPDGSARVAAMMFRLERRKSRDGQTRNKLSPVLAEAFLNVMLWQRLDQEIALRDLRAMHDRMAGLPAVLPQRGTVIAG